MRVFGIKAFTLAVVATLATLLVTFQVSESEAPPLESYCCVCDGCSTGASRQCISVETDGLADTNCPKICATPPQNCQFFEVLEGQCAIHAAECIPSLAPAASQPVLFALGVLLAGGGVYLVRRRVVR
jgi:hypothetical protein